MAGERTRRERKREAAAVTGNGTAAGAVGLDQASAGWFKLFQSAPIGIAQVSLDGRFESVNRALCDMFGYSEAWLLAADVADLNHPDDDDSSRANISRLAGDAHAEVSIEKRYVHADGHVVWALVNAVPITVDGVIDHVMAFYVDITGRREIEAKLLASEAELRTVQNVLPDAVQVFRQDGTLSYRNPAAERFYRLRPEERTTDIAAGRWELLNEDAAVMAIDDGPLATAMRTGQASERVVVGIRDRPGTTVRWLSISTVPIRRPHAEATGYVSIARDVTERIQTIRELKVLSIASEQLSASLVRGQVLRALTSAAAAMCSGAGEEPRRAQLFVIDGEMVVITGAYDPAGPVTTEGVRLPIAEHPFIQRVIATRQAVVAALNYADFGPLVAERLRLSEITNCAWIPLTRNDHVYAVLTVAGRTHALIQPTQLERLKTLAAIGELALSNAEAHELVADMARTDPLTGVGNRRALADQFRRMPRSRFALLAMDVDGLKKVNDAHGHDAGDILLSRLAVALAAELRPADLLARTGGDEFMAVLVDCDARGASDLGRRLQRAAANVTFPWGTASISVGSAAGVAGDRPEAVAKAADLALYEAKPEAGTRR